MTKTYTIGDFSFALTYPEEIPIPDNFAMFEAEVSDVDYTYTMTLEDSFPEPEGELLACNADLHVFGSDGLETRYIGVKGAVGFYGYYSETDERNARILVPRSGLELIASDPGFVSLFALERRMLGRAGMILHCAYMSYQGEAILFSAPSETGKSTQANLWEQYRGSSTVNGDRSLLQKIEGRWHAQGWPVCGSSEICNDIATPIRAIVMLSQERDNFVERLRPLQAFSQVYSQITVNRWNAEDHGKAMDLIEQLILEIPVYHLGCTISREAVERLEEALYPKE